MCARVYIYCIRTLHQRSVYYAKSLIIKHSTSFHNITSYKVKLNIPLYSLFDRVLVMRSKNKSDLSPLVAVITDLLQ